MTHLPLAYSAPQSDHRDWLALATKGAAFTALLFSGAIFGFFYAWVCSTMWGLDEADPRTAIAAMQAMNASVRNMVFAPAFFGTPFVLWIAAFLAWTMHKNGAAFAFAAGGAFYACGGLILTMTVNVPMNEALAAIVVPTDVEGARAIWTAYSDDWQVYNVIRTVFSGITLTLAGIALPPL